jgi:hypothetical protein
MQGEYSRLLGMLRQDAGAVTSEGSQSGEHESSFSWEISETFTMSDGTTVTGWTELLGDWAINTNRLDPPDTGNVRIYNNTALDSATRQAIKVHVLQDLSSGGQAGILCRINTSTGDFYEVTFDDTTGYVFIAYYDNWSYSGQTTNRSMAVTFPGWIGVEVTGTGNDTTWACWSWGESDPGDWDASHTNWGSPDYTITDNPGVAANDGTNVGLGGYDMGASHYYDDFYAVSASE